MELIPAHLPPVAATGSSGVFKGQGLQRGRVAMLAGCAQSVLDPGINAAAIRLLNRLGIEVVIAAGAGCCGALTQHMGREVDARMVARRNIHAWGKLRDEGGLDAILITASGCGTTVKDYGHLFRGDVDHPLAEAIGGLALDVSEYLHRIGLPAVTNPPGLKVAYHAACSLQHGQQVREAPKDLLRQAGFDVLEVPDGHLCCGSAGTYNLLQPDIAGELRRRKIASIAGTGRRFGFGGQHWLPATIAGRP